MEGNLHIIVLIVVFALAFDFINGFHDTANSIATSVSTKALKPRHAILMAACTNFLGAMTFTGVAKAITKDIVDPFSLPNGTLVILSALIAAITWNLITWYVGIPSSSSHAEIILNCNRSECSVFVGNVEIFFCFNSLVQPVTEGAAIHYPSGKLIY